MSLRKLMVRSNITICAALIVGGVFFLFQFNLVGYIMVLTGIMFGFSALWMLQTDEIAERRRQRFGEQST